MKLIQHHYAEKAYQHVMNAKTNEENFSNQYGQLCHRFASMILINGLRLTITFFEAKSKKGNAYQQFVQDIKETLDIQGDWSASNRDYLIKSRQALNASVWLKRYAESILKVEQGAENVEDIQ
ncbi:type III-B CRISPR module-associated protein Cmr5 [Bacillus pumilus]|uniref:type III-B CRISPR module-associated protein Cmr5 n=1 Tax=Bacillus pumilus TaxID=1408 RepID=UPI001C2511A5|nr:type III-B CRISPR module-associated protein Cmr5 [Bacillus pumilus]MBU8638164.1 type III-B CRISPR module-associated protein Cmr5 [Bacillus pumilus]MBU8656324.1 type III-B CRISPR module-associated protein Cmr5 [Bacillus pumilus]